MRVLKLITVSVLVSKVVFSQAVPTPPETPIAYNTVTSSSSESISITDADVISSSSSSVSISDTNKTYKFKSKFDASRKEGIKGILKDELGAIKLIKKGNDIIWRKSKNSVVVFECKLSKKSLNIISNKQELSLSFNTQIHNLGEELSNFISGKKNRLATQTLSAAQVRLEKAKMELERSMKNLERVKREREY